MKSVLLKAGMTPSYIINTGLTNACLACSPLNFEVWPPFFMLLGYLMRIGPCIILIFE